MQTCEKIFRTVAWFDVFGFPVTTEEISRYAEEPLTIGEVVVGLKDLTDRLACQDGFWFIKEWSGLVEERMRRARIAERKWRRARHVAKFLAMLPGVRRISVANTLAFDAARDESDIDLFVVVKTGWLWTFRLLAVGLLKMFGLRPYEGGSRDAICLSFMVDESATDLAALAIENDRYLDVWQKSLVPIFGGKNMSVRRTVRPFVRLPAWGRSPIEKWARRFQERRFPETIKQMMNRDTRVVVTDHILKFHANDRRAEYRDLWLKKLS